MNTSAQRLGYSKDVRNDHVDDGRAAPGCGNLRQKRSPRKRKRKRKGGDEAAGGPEGRQRRRGRHLSWVSALENRRKNQAGNLRLRLRLRASRYKRVRRAARRAAVEKGRKRVGRENHDLLGFIPEFSPGSPMLAALQSNATNLRNCRLPFVAVTWRVHRNLSRLSAPLPPPSPAPCRSMMLGAMCSLRCVQRARALRCKARSSLHPHPGLSLR